MNFHYLVKYISRRLHTIILQHIWESGITESYCARASFSDQFEPDRIFTIFSDILPFSKYASSLGASFGDTTSVCLRPPVILTVNTKFIYTMVSAADRCFVIGPVRLSPPVHFRHTYSITPAGKEWEDTVPICEFNDLFDCILLLCNLCREDEITAEMLIAENCIDSGTEDELQQSFSELVFENREEGKRHNPYDQELREFSSIENGDPDRLKKSLEEDYTGEVGLLADEPLRNAKNRAIVVVALACRAAMRGGIVPETAYSLSDSYIQKIEKCKDIPSVFHLFHTAEYEYAQMVKELKERKKGIPVSDRNPYIDKCKNYIFSHLHGRITVHEIADAIGLNAGYLSELFHKYEHITLTEYIRREKISLAKNLLTYSEYSYSEIATYLGFSSQSHLGKYFRAATGMTMRQYRNTYGVRAFESGKSLFTGK